MKKLTVELTELEYVELKAYLAGYEISLKSHVMNNTNINWLGTYEEGEEKIKAKKRYNEGLKKALKRCRYEIPEIEKLFIEMQY